MLTHSIAGLKVGIEYNHPKMINQCARYITQTCKTDFDIILPEGYLSFVKNQNPHLSMEDCEYTQTGMVFYKQLVAYSGMMLHASSVIKDKKAYLFSAPSGTGKSTHTQLWLKTFPDAKILNDDKPALRFENGKVIVYGTPWSGKTNLNLNESAELGGICFLERAKENYIEKISSAQAISMVLNQTVRPRMLDNIETLLNVLDKIISNSKVYKMGCNISTDAAILAHDFMSNNLKKER